MAVCYAARKGVSPLTAIEYGLIAAAISVAIIAVVNGLGSKLNTTFDNISNQLNDKPAISQPANTR